MPQTLVINTPDASRKNWNAVRVALNRNGFEVHDYHARITETGMCLVAKVQHSNAEVAARDVERELTTGSTLYILH
jgi:hypothetical protein